ncbi:MerR family transcriptional regulator [Streptomyces sp. RTd22]|uniref:DNA polymerase III subunit beta family protein n=1 Tax=Streptomyces sp. RTd22 TaxID=1841249 RepID=UPI0007C54195|nr:MerR family transcriptional regulator [Streptomyces sp. RTd22]
MNDDEPLMGIGAFARRVGLTPSALRFYDDCAVLRPARVDAATGYRYYAPEQAPRATLLRRLREAELPLVEATAVLDGPPEEAREVLRAHLRRSSESAAAARAAIEDVLRELPGGVRRGQVRVGGAELAGAVRQVGSAVATDAVREEFPVLGRVLLELAEEELRLVATDRYRLSVRALRPIAISGEPCGVPVGIEELREVASWARGLAEVAIEVAGAEVRVRGGGEERGLPVADEVFPAYRMVLDGLATARHRVITDRSALCAAVAERGGDGPVVLRTGDGELTVEGGRTLSALCTGPPLRIAFDPALLLSALEAGVGPDVLLEVVSGAEPVVVRSADQGSFTTLVMPVRTP